MKTPDPRTQMFETQQHASAESKDTGNPRRDHLRNLLKRERRHTNTPESRRSQNAYSGVFEMDALILFTLHS